MSEASDPAGLANGSGKAAYYAAPALVFLAIVVQFLRYHEYNLALPESLILIGGTCIVGLGVGAIASIYRNRLGSLLILGSVGIYLYFSKDFAAFLAPIGGFFADLLGPVPGLLPIGLLFLVAAILLFRLRGNLPIIVSVIFATIVATSVVLPTSKGGEPTIEGNLPADLNDLPPIVHIVLDEHIGLAGLPVDMEAGRTMVDTLASTYSDFALFSRAYSRFGETQYSLAALVNAGDVGDMGKLLSYRDTLHDLNANAWLEKLKGEGYAIHVYQTPWLDFCRKSEIVDVCDTYPMYSPNAVQRTSLGTVARLRVLLDSLNPLGTKPILSSLSSSETLYRFQQDLEKAPRGVAYFVHLLLPHYDYIYDRDCGLRDSAEWTTQPAGHSTADQRHAAYDLYLAQMTCTAKRLRSVFDEMKRLGVYDEAIIIIHGDHGSRIGERGIHLPPETLTDRDLLDHFSTLLALKMPGMAPGIRDESVELQRVFAEIFLGKRIRETTAAGEVVIRDDATNAFRARRLIWPDGGSSPVTLDARQVSQNGQPGPPQAE